ncbi:MAG: glycosyltransferase family 2 protein [Panacagrimonas sp.]
MTTPALCSVIVPVFRHEAWIEACLQSVLQQSHPRLELIVIDDCSPDRSFEISERLCISPVYRQRFERVVCLRNPRNIGAHASLNRGLDVAQGDYVFLLNSDDRYHPERVARMLSALQVTGGRFAFSGIELLVSPNAQVPVSLIEGLARLSMQSGLLPSLSFAFLRFNCAVTTGNFAMRRDLIEVIGRFIDLKLTHDWDFALRAILHEEPLYVPDALYGYRIHASNSFTDVADRAEVETEVCHARYFAAVAAGPVPNRSAPGPYNWPQVFEHHLQAWGMMERWNRVTQGIVRHGRTLDPRAANAG